MALRALVSRGHNSALFFLAVAVGVDTRLDYGSLRQLDAVFAPPHVALGALQDVLSSFGVHDTAFDSRHR